MTTINFCYPYRPPNGVSALFVRLANLISLENDLRIRVIDFPDGAMAREMDRAGKVELISFYPDRSVEIPADEILVLQGEIPSRLRRQFRISSRTRLIYWQLHPFNFIPSVVPMFGHRLGLTDRPNIYRALARTFIPGQLSKAVEFVKLLNEKQSVIFMDQTGVSSTEAYLDCKVKNPRFVPVALAIPEAPVRTARVALTELHVAWIGRLYDFKIHILIHTIQRFAAHAATAKSRVVFHVIGDGPKGKLLESIANRHDWFEMIRVSDLERSDLRTYLIEKIDLVAAMGTAALESAAIGLPVIALDFSYTPLARPYRFRWLQHAKGFDLGHPITAADKDADGQSLAALLTELQLNYARVAQESFLYCLRQHSLATVADRFLDQVGRATLRFGDISPGLLRKSAIRRIYEFTRH